jgi:hypothetical protein
MIVGFRARRTALGGSLVLMQLKSSRLVESVTENGIGPKSIFLY